MWHWKHTHTHTHTHTHKIFEHSCARQHTYTLSLSLSLPPSLKVRSQYVSQYQKCGLKKAHKGHTLHTCKVCWLSDPDIEGAECPNPAHLCSPGNYIPTHHIFVHLGIISQPSISLFTWELYPNPSHLCSSRNYIPTQHIFVHLGIISQPITSLFI